MSLNALRTIKALNWRKTRFQCQKMVNNFLDVVSKKYPDGFSDIKDSKERLIAERKTYFVMPGFEHVTKNQPIAQFDVIERTWKLSTITNHYLEKNYDKE